MNKVIALGAALAVTAPLYAQVARQELPGVRNFTRVDATIGCAGATSPEAMKGIRELGFVSIVNLRLATEEGVDIDAARTAASDAGLRYIHLPFDHNNPSDAVVEQFLATVADTANQPVFIHCGSANRVAALWMVKRVIADGWDRARAEEEARAIGLTSEKLHEFAIQYIARRQPPAR